MAARLLQLAGFTIHPGQQESGRLPNIIAIHWKAAAVLRVCQSYSDPLHQRRQYEKRPAGGDKMIMLFHKYTLFVFTNDINIVSTNMLN